GALEVRRVPDGGHVVVCGLGNVGYRCVEELAAIGERVVAIDRTNDNPFIATCRRKGIPTFVGDATVTEVLRQARADTAKAVVAVVVQESDPCLGGKSLRAAVTDYRFLPVAVGAKDPAAVPDHRLRPGDRLTAVLELPDLERMLRREPVPRDHAVTVDAVP